MNLKFSDPTYNCDTMVQDVTCDEPHTFKEWKDWAIPKYGKIRLTIIVNKYTTVFEMVNGNVMYCSVDMRLYSELFDIYEMRDSWGQVTIYLRLHNEPTSENNQPEWCVTITD